MSTELASIPNTGTHNVPLYITEFCGPIKHGLMLQLTQEDEEEYHPRYIQLTETDAIQLMVRLEEWIYTKGVKL